MKKNVLKKGTAALTTAALLSTLLLAGCSGSENSGESAEPGSGNLSILCWSNESDFAPVLDGFKAKYPDIKVDFQHVPSEGNQYQQKLIFSRTRKSFLISTGSTVRSITLRKTAT